MESERCLSTAASQNSQQSEPGCRRRRHSLHLHSPSSSFLFLVILALLQASSQALSPRCLQPPPTPNCGTVYQGVGFYYNATSPARCLGWPNWGCPDNQLFATNEDCRETCIEDEPPPTTLPPPPPPTLSPEEICSLPVRNYICAMLEVRELWVYNPTERKCHILRFFMNCLAVQPNMFATKQDCIDMCGPFSPFYTDPTPELTVIEISTSSSLSSPSPSSLPSPLVTMTPSPYRSTLIKLHPTTTSTRPTPIATRPHPIPTPTDEPTNPDLATSSAPDNKLQPSNASPLTVFDMASIAVGALIVVLIVVMVILIASFVHRRRKVLGLMRQAPPTVIKSMSNPCSHQGNGSVVHFVNDDVTYSSSPTTSSYCV